MKWFSSKDLIYSSRELDLKIRRANIRFMVSRSGVTGSPDIFLNLTNRRNLANPNYQMLNKK